MSTKTEGKAQRDSEMAEALRALAKEVGVQVDAKVRSCLTCTHFDEASETCTMAGGSRPPARVIAFGCPAHNCPIPF